MGFHLIRDQATHLAGGHLDQAWLRDASKEYIIDEYSPYYTCKDHDALLFTYYDSNSELNTGDTLYLVCNYMKCYCCRKG